MAPLKDSKILSVEGLGVSLNGNSILRNLNFDVKAEETLAIVGPNGAGKSVLLRTLLGLHSHTGEVKWHNDPKISYIPQKFSIEKDMPLTVREFFEFKEKDIDRITQALAWVGINGEHHVERHLLTRRLGVISGGQLQRVLIAWSLIDNPDVLLYDEPTSGIDVGGEETIYTLLSRLKEKRSLTILLISHDLNIVYKYATNVLCVNHDMVCHGVPQEVLDPTALAHLYGDHASFYQHNHTEEK